MKNRKLLSSSCGFDLRAAVQTPTKVVAAGLGFFLLLFVVSAAAAPQGWYFILAGTRLVSLTHAPSLIAGGKQFVSAALLDELGLPAASSGPAAQAEGDSAALRGPDARSYKLGSHNLTLNLPGQPVGGALDGSALPPSVLASFGGQPYLSAEVLDKLGLSLCFNPAENLPQLCGRVTELNYDAARSRLVISALTPFSVQGTQEDSGVTLELDGALFDSLPAREYEAGPLSRIAVKSLPAQGRSFVYIRQPERSGFRIRSEPAQGFATIDFGNYFQLASAALTSSGEISINVQLGAPVKAEAQMLDGPPRLVLDFSGATYEDATDYIDVNAGHCARLRIGQPEPGRVRVVADLTQKLDYRLLSTDGGARYYCQLLPPAPAEAQGLGGGGFTAQHSGGGFSRRTEEGTATEVAATGVEVGGQAETPTQGGGISAAPADRFSFPSRNRVIMLDAGHGGSDPGASGVVGGVNEKSLALAMARMTQAELERLGYTVLQTRSDDRFVSLGARTDYANTVLPWIFVSIHCNSIEQPDFNGAMTFHHPAASAASRSLAALVQQSIVAATGCTDKGVREANFFVLRETVMPSILIETGFLSNSIECGRLCDDTYQRQIAAAIAQGIDAYVLGR